MRAVDFNEVFCVKRDREIVVRDTDSIVDPVYITRSQQIKSFIRSGQMLHSFRSSYEYPDGNVPADVSPDPTADIGFDLADASALAARLSKQAEAAKSEANKQQQARVGATAPEVNAGEADAQ